MQLGTNCVRRLDKRFQGLISSRRVQMSLPSFPISSQLQLLAALAFRCLLLQAAVWYYMEDACEVSVGACHARAVGSALMKTDVSSTNRFCLTISLLHVRTIKMRVFGKNEDFSAFAVTRANRFLLDDQFTTCSENQSREEMVSEGKSHAICCSNSWRRLVQR